MSSQASKEKGMGKRTMHLFFSKIEILSFAPDVVPDVGIPASNVDIPTLPTHEFVEFVGSLYEEIKEVIASAPGNAKYTSPDIQKEIVHLLANTVRKKIREEVGEAKFCLLVDESQDIANREQMAIVLRFVNEGGFLHERLFDVVGVESTCANVLKKGICDVLAKFDLYVVNMRGQGYDGASNMRGAWKGLHALFKKDCPSAYYVHCFAHRLQLALVAASKDVADLWLFFSKLGSIVNVITSSPKRHVEFQAVQKEIIDEMIANGELSTGRGLNQVCNLQRSTDTRWSSHSSSVGSVLETFDATCIVLKTIMKTRSSNSLRWEAHGSLISLKSFDFVFILHLMYRVMGITDLLCKALQYKTIDILSAINLVSSTKALLQEMRQNEWDPFINKVLLFCKKHDIDAPEMGDRYKVGTRRTCQQRDTITVESHYRIDLFIATIDFQLVELNNRFTDGAMELLRLSSALDPKDSYKAFNVDDLRTLAKKFYPQDFTKQERKGLKLQLQHYQLDIPMDKNFENLLDISELCRKLVETRKSHIYTLIDRLLRLVLTLPVSTATTERAFSAMKLVKTQLRNKMDDDFLADTMLLYVERDLARDIDLNSMIDEFSMSKTRRAPLMLK